MIIFIKIDRWFRSVSDYYKVQDVLDAHGVVWRATQEDYNTETRDGRLKINIMLSVAQDESDRTSERIKFVNESKLQKKGVLFGNQPMGYKVGEIDGEKRVVKDEKTAPIIEDLYNHYELHQSKRAALNYINDKYNLTLSYNSVMRYLSNPLYKGEYKGIKDYCEPYLTPERYDKIQEIMGRNVRVSRKKSVYLFSGRLTCPVCHTTLAGSMQAAGQNRATDYYYYRCNRAYRDGICTYRQNPSEKKIEKYLLENVEKQLEDYLIKAQIEEDTTPAPVIDKDALRAEMDRLNYMYQKNRISTEAYEAEISRIENKLDEVEMQPQKRDFSNLQGFLESDFKKIYTTFTRDEKRAMWLSIIDRIELNGDGTYTAIFL